MERRKRTEKEAEFHRRRTVAKTDPEKSKVWKNPRCGEFAVWWDHVRSPWEKAHAGVWGLWTEDAPRRESSVIRTTWGAPLRGLGRPPSTRTWERGGEEEIGRLSQVRPRTSRRKGESQKECEKKEECLKYEAMCCLCFCKISRTLRRQSK